MATTASSRTAKSKRRNGPAFTEPPPNSSTSSSSLTSVSGAVARLKTVVRRLPPNLPESVFWSSVAEWVNDETTTWKSYSGGKFKTRLGKENVPGRAYIAFRDEEFLVKFASAFDGHVFRDKTGNETAAIVEFAPYQKVPNAEGLKKKRDARIGTIEKDEDYISFIASLGKPTEPVTVDQLLTSTQQAPQPKTTPLLEALKAEREQRLAKEKEREITVRAIQQPPKREKKEKAKATKESSEKGKGAKKAAVVPGPPAAITSVQIASTSGPPKAPRAMRNQQQQQAKAPARGAPPPGATTRRGRPILGLGSRNFEAALSSVGGKKRDDKVKIASKDDAASPASASSPITVPAILKRSPVVVNKPLETEAAAAVPSPSGGSTQGGGGGGVPPPSRGMGRRGRGRGRGGGGPPRGGAA